MQQLISRLTNEQAMSVIARVEDVFKSVPHLPKGLSEFFVKIAPWIALIFGVLGILGAVSTFLLVFGLGSLGFLMAQAPNIGQGYLFVLAVFELLSSILMLISYKYLKNRALTGWVLMFWNSVLGLASSLIAVAMESQGIVGAIISILISFYILFEMKPFYDGMPAVESKEA